VSSASSTVVAVPNPWTNAMELRVVPNPLECPPAKDPHSDIAMFRRVAAEKIDKWRRNAYERQMVNHGVVNKAWSWKPAPLYQIDFKTPTYNPNEATVTLLVNRQD